MSSADPARKWQRPEVATSYRDDRFRDPRAAGRDGRLVERLLRRHAPDRRFERALDVPCGTGRLSPLLARRARSVVGLDRSAAMLGAGGAPGLLGDAERLPFRDGSFDLVLCCRLLHHLDPGAVERVLEELVRVGSDTLVVSFWNASGVQGWRRRLGLRRDPEGRRPIAPSRLEGALRAAGAEVLGSATSLPGWSLQSFLLARVRVR
jgi:SAM-dependent methyltransferase